MIDMKWMNGYYSQLIGYEITGFQVDGEGIYAWPVLVVQKGEETLHLTVSRDAEGNGPGFIFIENEDGQQLA